jgi:hypothetical protein
MATADNSRYIVPENMARCISEAYSHIFGSPISESVLLESQREIEAMTRDAVYKTIVYNMMGGRQVDWNSPRIQEMYRRIHDDHMKPVSQFLRDFQASPAGQHVDLPEFNEQSFTNRRGNELTLMQSILNNIRQTFFNFDGANRDYMPGVTRIALLRPGLGGCGFGSPEQDAGEVKLLKGFVKYACEVCPDPQAEGAEFDIDLNGMTLRDIRGGFGNALDRDLQDRREAVRSHAPAGHTGNYRIEHIPDFRTASRYARYFTVSPWCICTSQMMWDSYTLEGKNTVYFCLRDGFENVPAEPGENCPLDEYGISMIAVIVDPDGDLCTATPRWNDANGSSDYLMTEEDVVDIIGEPFYETFPPVETEDPEYVRQARRGMGMPPRDGRPIGFGM